MTPELKAKWIAALRSGKYEQGRRTLNNNGKMCCLGVLCDIAGYEWEKIPEEETHLHCAAGENYIENNEEAAKLGLSEPIQRICYSLNDGTFSDDMREEFGAPRPFSFLEIADWLEKNL